MSIHTHVGVQLPMFLSPAEIVCETEHGNWSSVDLDEYVDDYDDGVNEMWDDKLNESYDKGYVDAMPYWDVFNPVVVKISPWYSLPTLGNGHHRIITALEINMPFIPVIWTATQTHATINTRDDSFNNSYDSWQ